MIPTDRVLVYVCAAMHRMRWTRKGFRHLDRDEQAACTSLCIGAVPRPEPNRPTFTLIKGGKP